MLKKILIIFVVLIAFGLMIAFFFAIALTLSGYLTPGTLPNAF